MSKKVLFFPDVYQEHGHWHPAITLAQQLEFRGYQAKYMGIADCESIVRPYVGSSLGSKFYRIFEKEYPFGYTKANPHKSVNERWKPVHLWNIINGGLDGIMNEYKPDLIVSGYFASLETLLMHYKYGVKFMILTTYLRHPDDDPGIRAIQNLVGMSEPMARTIMKVYDDYYKKQIIPGTSSALVDPDELTVYDFVKPLEMATELIPCPREFEFDNYRFDSDIDHVGGSVKFIEPCVTREASSNQDQEVPSWRTGIPHEKLDNKKIIYVTSGSQTQDYIARARGWFWEMIKMMGMQGMQGYHLVMSVGPELIRERWPGMGGPAQNNVSIYSWVPQLDVLGHCAAAYIHGGLATIKECIHRNVPFVILPLGKDQTDNALRARRKNIAQIAYAEADWHGHLQSLFLKMTTDNWMRGNLSRMHNLFVRMENSRPGINFIINELNN